jgi:hypothetical protein
MEILIRLTSDDMREAEGAVAKGSVVIRSLSAYDVPQTFTVDHVAGALSIRFDYIDEELSESRVLDDSLTMLVGRKSGKVLGFLVRPDVGTGRSTSDRIVEGIEQQLPRVSRPNQRMNYELIKRIVRKRLDSVLIGLESNLDDVWFEKEAGVAIQNVSKLGLTGHMELRFAVGVGVSKSQIELLNAVRGSQIHTFGWPIGVTLQNREEFRPQPYSDGIRAEVSITRSAFNGMPSYDYWALRTNGDFYLLQSLFEDSRASNKIFFNTRIVRVTEALLFAAELYQRLEVPQDATLKVRVVHRGLAGRELTSSSPNRLVWPSTARENEAKQEISVALGTVRGKLTEYVRQLTAPMFVLFDFKEFPESVYHDIVEAFVRGDTTRM